METIVLFVFQIFTPRCSTRAQSLSATPDDAGTRVVPKCREQSAEKSILQSISVGSKYCSTGGILTYVEK